MTENKQGNFCTLFQNFKKIPWLFFIIFWKKGGLDKINSSLPPPGSLAENDGKKYLRDGQTSHPIITTHKKGFFPLNKLQTF